MVVRTAMRHRWLACLFAASLALLPALNRQAAAQSTPAPATAPDTTGAPQATPPDDTPAAPDASKPSGDASSAQALTLTARPVALLKGASTWDDGYKTITDSFQKVRDALAANGIKGDGHPFAMFTETDDTGFKFQAMLPIDKPPDGKTSLSADVSIGELPAGKVLKFQHRGAYEEIDATYEAITAYLDEKGLEAKNLFLEEYLNDVKGSDDTSLAVDIYVYIK